MSGRREGREGATSGADRVTRNSAHASRGCRQANLQATGGNGLFYCIGIG
jgi:hypothetical protein